MATKAFDPTLMLLRAKAMSRSRAGISGNFDLTTLPAQRLIE
jgi:hypothetical protein